jgi:hypothetical protein
MYDLTEQDEELLHEHKLQLESDIIEMQEKHRRVSFLLSQLDSERIAKDIVAQKQSQSSGDTPTTQ